MTLSPANKRRFTKIQKRLLDWHKTNARQFSWRKKHRDPYEVLVCEVMGQQTQASRIELYLPKFLKSFPDAESLAGAKKSDIIREWQGLGYNRRVLNLQKAATAIAGNGFPTSEKNLLALPGVGKYTARAVLIFAFNRSLATVDVNVERVLSRLYRPMDNYESFVRKQDIYPLAETLVPKNRSRQWHEAVMDFGATICTKRNPKCQECPLSELCKNHNKFESPIPSPLRSAEKRYFGKPKRIWRGKVLKLIAGKPSSRNDLISALQNSFPSGRFKIFIHEVLRELISEGFCEKRNKNYQLPQE